MSICTIKDENKICGKEQIIKTIQPTGITRLTLNQNEEGANVAEGFFTMDAIDAGEAAADSDNINLEYYGYKKSGLKIVASTKSSVDTAGIKEDTDSKTTVFVLDDGRMEKGEGSVKVSASGDVAGIKAEGNLDISYKISYKWNAK